MRLSKIKVAGFKSFVDPTTLTLRSNLIGVVGPNGCGKSNVIDAVRWVMGESSAKNLRGDSMADVIFNGSTQRKPVGQASVELIFDNSEKRLGGQYAQYNEISVKRSVSRDGSSSYFLNSSRCRRKDITDIFLGTGLGPRSYAIIEQGMISRLIEARPEELRIFIEEAAGISKYKERRRETGNRIGHTRENLERLLDLKDEVEKQLEKLKRQARTAERYKELKQEERLLKAQLLALRLGKMAEDNAELNKSVQEQETSYEKDVAELRHLEAELEKNRAAQIDSSDTLNEVQGNYYRIGTDIARVEQNIQHLKERGQQLKLDLQQAEQGIGEARSHLDMDERQIADFGAQLEELEPRKADYEQRAEASRQGLEQAEQAMADWQGRWETLNQDYSSHNREVEVRRTSITHREQHMMKLQQRLEALQQEMERLGLGDLEEQITDLENRDRELAQALEQQQEQIQALLTEIGHQRELIQDGTLELDEARNRLQQLRGRFASLEALQQAALGKNESGITRWLEHQGLNDGQRLAQGLDVDEGWERAVETVLGFNLEAVCTDGLDPVAGVLHTLEHGSLAVFDTSTATAAAPARDRDLPLLADKIRSPWAVHSLTGAIYAAADLNAALAVRGQLAAGESVITRDGVWIGPNWLRVARDNDERAGVIAREHELKSLTAEIEQLERQEQSLGERQQHHRDLLHDKEAQREELQEQLAGLNREHSDIRSRISSRRAHHEQMGSRRNQVQQELADIQQQISSDREQLADDRTVMEASIQDLETLADRRESLSTERDSITAGLQQAREQAHQDRDAAHELNVKIQSARTALQTSTQSLERVRAQMDQLMERRDRISTDLEQSGAPLQDLNTELEELLGRRMEAESRLGEARKAVEEIDHAMREQNQQRHEAEKRGQEKKEALDKARYAIQEIKIRTQTLMEQLAETGCELEQLVNDMPEQASVENWQQRVSDIEGKIQRLGAINLAAIEEYQEQLERKEYLDSQHADLTEALETLEGAIAKIDKETKARFRETFEQVNTGFKDKFPRIFGGGSAYLELVGDDLLTSGISVMARPPGKRNSTIHLLSGGEKALTAIALVFSIFDLNPAPFCLLDEVDAPLDDANVGRYCSLIREMSEKTQFIFITHNKITMELADQINGVTMQEPGVSRLVAVDVDEAVQMAAV